MSCKCTCTACFFWVNLNFFLDYSIVVMYKKGGTDNIEELHSFIRYLLPAYGCTLNIYIYIYIVIGSIDGSLFLRRVYLPACLSVCLPFA